MVSPGMTTFVFPAQASTPTPRPVRKQEEDVSRDSSALRASVLDAALELGIGANSVVANWMFNNAVEEEEELEEQVTRDFVRDAPSPSPSSSQATHITYAAEERAPSNKPSAFLETAAADGASMMSSNRLVPAKAAGKPMAFPDSHLLSPDFPSTPTTPSPSVYSSGAKKLRKPKKGFADGYDSDAGYLSEGGSKKKDNKKSKLKDGNSTLDGHVAQDEGLIVPEERKRKKSLVDVVRGSTKKKEKVSDGYATEGGSLKNKKAKPKVKPSKDKESMDETDGSSIKSKTRNFFGLSSKSSKSDMARETEPVPAVPSLKESRPLPIAQKFANTSTSRNEHELLIGDFERPNSLTISLPSAVSSDVPPPSAGAGSLPSLSLRLSSATTETVDTSSISRPESLPPNAAPVRPVSQQNSIPPVSYSQGQKTATIDSRASTGSSSSGGSHPRSLTSGGLSPSMSSSVNSPATSQSNFQISSPPRGVGLGPAGGSMTSSFSQQTPAAHGYGFVPPKTDGSATALPQQRMSGSKFTSPMPPTAVGSPAGMQSMTFQIARDISTVPLMMQRQRQRQSDEPQPQDEDRLPLQTVVQTAGTDEVAVKPLKRSSLLAPVVPLNITNKGGGLGLKLKPSLEKLNILRKGESKEQPTAPVVGGASPVSPSEHSVPFTKSWPSTGHHSPIPSLASRNGQPMAPPDKPSPITRALSPHSFSISSPNTAMSSLSSTPPLSAASSSSSSDRYRLRSPMNMTLSPPRAIAPPNVLAYYDIPPASPPPMGPLPVPPPARGDGNNNGRSTSTLPLLRNRSRSPIPPPSHSAQPDAVVVGQFPSPAQLRQRMIDRTPRTLPVEDAIRGPGGGGGGRGVVPTFNSNIKRGVESPFPSEPVSNRPLASLNAPSAASDESMDSGELGTKRFRNASPQPPPPSTGLSNNPQTRWLSRVPNGVKDSVTMNRRTSWLDFKGVLGKSVTNDYVSGPSNEEYEENPSDYEDMRDSLDTNGSMPSAGSDVRGVFDRLTGHNDRSNRSDESHRLDGALARRRSFDSTNAYGAGTGLPPSSPQQRNRFAWDDAATIGDRTSRWSGSIYSRMSIMDEDESNEARDRFVKRVEAMLAGEGKRKEINNNEGGGDDDDDQSSGEGGVGPTKTGGTRRGSRGTRFGREEYIPPVPKIPEVFASSRTSRSGTVAAGLAWNKF